MTTKIIFIVFISMLRVIACQAQEMMENEDFNKNQPKYNQENFRDFSQNYWEIENSKSLYEIVSNSNDTIRLDSLDMNDIRIKIFPNSFLLAPKMTTIQFCLI